MVAHLLLALRIVLLFPGSLLLYAGESGAMPGILGYFLHDTSASVDNGIFGDLKVL